MQLEKKGMQQGRDSMHEAMEGMQQGRDGIQQDWEGMRLERDVRHDR